MKTIQPLVNFEIYKNRSYHQTSYSTNTPVMKTQRPTFIKTSMHWYT